MAIRPVLHYPDPRLKLPCAPVGRPGPAIRRLAADMHDTARAHPRTVGIAAPQIGQLWRVAWVDCTGHPKVPEAQGPMWLIDPVVVERSGNKRAREGCLSLPEITANVRRPARVVVEATDLDGSRRAITATGFEARVILHEIDHLDGILILDRVISLALDVFTRVEVGPEATPGSG